MRIKTGHTEDNPFYILYKWSSVLNDKCDFEGPGPRACIIGFG